MPLTIQVFIPAGETTATLTAITGTGTAANPYTITQQGSSRFGTIEVADAADLLGLWQIEVGTRFVRKLQIVAGQTDYPLQGSQEAAAAAITAAGLPAATSAKIAADCELGDNGWDAAKIAIADAVWGFTVAVVDMANVSAATVLSGVLTLLARVTDLVRTKEDDDAADEVILEAIGEIEGGGGGGDATEEKQDQIIALIAGQQVIQVPSPNVDGNLVLTQGDTYDGIGNPKAQWNVTTDYTDGWGVSLTIRDEDDNVVYFAAGVVASETLITVVIDTPTGLPMQGCPGVWKGKFDVELVKNQSVKTIALGACYIQEDQTR
jgi:hypothetical protein